MGTSCPSPISIQGSVCSSSKSRLLLSFMLEKAPFLVEAFFAPFDTSHITPLAQFLALRDMAEGHSDPKAPGDVAGGDGRRPPPGLEKGEPPGHRRAARMGPAPPCAQAHGSRPPHRRSWMRPSSTPTPTVMSSHFHRAHWYGTCHGQKLPHRASAPHTET